MALRSSILSAFVLPALGLGALAADLLPPSSAPTPALPAFSWTGVYAGVHGGYGFGQTEFSVAPLFRFAGLGSNGWLLGARAGFDWQFAQRWVGGIVGEYNVSDINSRLGIGPVAVELGGRNSRAARARLGFLVTPSTMVYATAGWVQTNTRLSVGPLGLSQSFSGSVIGSGIETRIHGNWFLNAEYLHNFFNGRSLLGVVNVKPTVGVARAGLSYKFGVPGVTSASADFATPVRANWTGFFAGVHGGYAWSNTTLAVPGLVSFRGVGSKGLTGGIIAGYDRPISPNLVAGIEADASVSDVRSTINVIGFNITGKSDWSAGIRGRLGYLITPGTLPYVALGYGWKHASIRTPIPFIAPSTTFSGVQAAAGIETIITPNIFARAEYVHTFNNSRTLFIAPLTWKPDSGKVRVGLTYKFDRDIAAIAAKY